MSNNLDVDSIISSGLFLDIITKPATSTTNGVINIGNKEYHNKCDIYFYGRVHHIVNTDDDKFFTEVDGFLNQSGF